MALHDFTGIKTVAVDKQCRITLPADIRDEFKSLKNEAAERDGVSKEDAEKAPCKVCLIYLRGALWGFTPEGRAAWIKRYFGDDVDESSAKYQDRLLKFNYRTATVELDKAGRLPVGKAYGPDLEKLGLGSEAVVIGNQDHIEIYNAATWSARQAALEAEDDDIFN